MRRFLFALCFLLGVGCLCSCKKTTSSICSLLLTADSLMWAKPDTALLLLEQVATPQKLRGADRALYALLMTQARYKSCKLLGNDSLIKIAVDYYEGTKDWEKLAKAHFYWGCIYMEQQELPKAIELYLKAIDVMPQGMDSIF